MSKNKSIILLLMLLYFATAKAQTDSSFLKHFPYLIGNIAFAVDSLETPIGKLAQGADTSFEIKIYNAGNEPVSLSGGKSNRFVNITYSAGTLFSHDSGFAKIFINVPPDLPPGKTQFEAVFETSDKINPYKFLYFSAEITKRNIFSEAETIDSVPRLIFNDYLYDFGYLRKGKTFYHTFYFTNRGSMDLFLKEIVVDKGLVIMELPPKIVKSGKNGHITVKIKARRYIGVLHKSIKIVSNDPVNPVITLGIHGTIKINPSKKNPTDYCIDN